MVAHNNEFLERMTSSYAEKYSSDGRLPAEYLVRMLKGVYPRLSVSRRAQLPGQILDAGCGDGRHIPVLSSLGHAVSAFEVDQRLADIAVKNSLQAGCTPDIRVGTNKAMPFPDAVFDGAVSWNQIYYLEAESDFPLHVHELARVLKPGAWVIMSVPMESAFIFDSSELVGERVVRVTDDYFSGGRNGALMRVFEGQSDIVDTFSHQFEGFVFGEQRDDAFGLAYHWHLVAMYRKSA